MFGTSLDPIIESSMKSPMSVKKKKKKKKKKNKQSEVPIPTEVVDFIHDVITRHPFFPRNRLKMKKQRGKSF